MAKSNEDFKNLIRQKTYEDLMRKLKKYKKCAVIRPTGFGKTWLLASLIFQYKKVLYLYPAEVIRETVENRYNDLVEEEMDVDEETLESLKAEGLACKLSDIDGWKNKAKALAFDRGSKKEMSTSIWSMAIPKPIAKESTSKWDSI